MYGICEYFLPESGLPASVAAGFIVGKREVIDKERLDNLIGELAQLAITVLFPLLAADVSWGELSPLGWGGVVCVFMLMVIVRPISIWIATMGRDLNLKEKNIFSLVSPKRYCYCSCSFSFFYQIRAGWYPWGWPSPRFSFSYYFDDSRNTRTFS